MNDLHMMRVIAGVLAKLRASNKEEQFQTGNIYEL